MLRLTLERADLEPGTSGAQMSAAAAALWADRPARALELLKRVDPAVDLAWSTDTTHFATGATSRRRCICSAGIARNWPPRIGCRAGAPLDRAWLRGSRAGRTVAPHGGAHTCSTALCMLPVETASDIGLAPYTDGRPQYTVTPAWVANWISRELAVHGDTVAARQAASRAVAWYRSRPPEERATPEERLVATWSLEILGAYPRGRTHRPRGSSPKTRPTWIFAASWRGSPRSAVTRRWRIRSTAGSRRTQPGRLVSQRVPRPRRGAPRPA